MRFRTLIVLLSVVLFIALIPIAIYALHFGTAARLSSETATWGAFGSYVGGILGPLFAIFAFVVLLANFRIQQHQWNYLERKERKEEWRDAIRDADRLLQEQLKTPVTVLTGRTMDLLRLLEQVAGEVLPSGKCYDPAYADTIFAKYTTEVNVSSFRGTAALVSDIWELLDGFSENLTEQDSRLLSFYGSYFQGVTTRLHTIGAIDDQYWKTRLGKIVAKLMHKAAGFAVPAKSDTNVASGD
jgi:uncharacterized membrane protein